MDKTALKIKYGFEIETPCTAEETTGPQPTRKQMQFKHVTLDIDGPVAILKLDHQEVMNAVSIDMLGGPRRGARRHRRQQGRGPLRSSSPAPGVRSAPAPTCRAATTKKPGKSNGRRRAGNCVPSVPAASAQPALSDRHLGQWTGGRRRHELRADGRHDPVRAVVLFPASLPPHRPGAGLRIDLACCRG